MKSQTISNLLTDKNACSLCCLVCVLICAFTLLHLFFLPRGLPCTLVSSTLFHMQDICRSLLYAGAAKVSSGECIGGGNAVIHNRTFCRRPQSSDSSSALRNECEATVFACTHFFCTSLPAVLLLLTSRSRMSLSPFVFCYAPSSHCRDVGQ